MSIRSDAEQYLQEVQVPKGDYLASCTPRILPENSVAVSAMTEGGEGASFRKVDDCADASGFVVDIHRYFEFARGSS